MIQALCDAIEERNLVSFHYGGGARVVEPYCYGEGSKGQELLRAFQVSGYSRSKREPYWRLFTVDEISHLTLLEETFEENRPEYNPVSDKHIPHVYCKI